MNSLIPDRDPNLEYGSILPFAVDRTTDETYFAYPEFVRDLVSVFETPARVARGEIQDMDELRRAAADVALNYTPAGGLAGIATGTRGLAMGAARSEADKSSTGLSGLRWYRGTANLSELNVVSGGKEGTLGGGGVYLTPNPESASMYASETITGAPKTGGFVLPLTAKFDNPLIVELNKEKGYFAEGRVLEELGMNREKAFDKAEKALDTKGSLTNEVKSKAIKEGYDGVVLVRDGEIQEAISYRPEDIRSIFEGGTKATDDIIDNLDFEPDDIFKETFGEVLSDEKATGWLKYHGYDPYVGIGPRPKTPYYEFTEDGAIKAYTPYRGNKSGVEVKTFRNPTRKQLRDWMGYKSGGRVERNPYNHEPKAI